MQTKELFVYFETNETPLCLARCQTSDPGVHTNVQDSVSRVGVCSNHVVAQCFGLD